MSLITRKDKNVTVSALFGVAAIQIFVGAIASILSWMTSVHYFGVLDVLFVISGVGYVILGLAARRARLPAAIIASVLFVALQRTRASMSVAFLTGGILTLLVVALLFVAVVAALKRPAADKET